MFRPGVKVGYSLAVSFVAQTEDSKGGVAKWLRRRSAKPLLTGSTPVAASNLPGRRLPGEEIYAQLLCTF